LRSCVAWTSRMQSRIWKVLHTSFGECRTCWSFWQRVFYIWQKRVREVSTCNMHT
jgi:hypothetical protein